MRHWAYEALGDSKILEFVVMATADDIDANAEFIAEADFYVEVPPGPNSNNYANLHLIVQVRLASASHCSSGIGSLCFCLLRSLLRVCPCSSTCPQSAAGKRIRHGSRILGSRSLAQLWSSGFSRGAHSPGRVSG